jgi:hypothetical protein
MVKADELLPETGWFTIAIQDQDISIINYKTHILKGVNIIDGICSWEKLSLG